MVIGINTQEDDPRLENAKKFKAKHRLTYPIWLDEKDVLLKKFNEEESMPTSVLLDYTLTVKHIEMGFEPEETPKKLVKLVKGLIAKLPASSKRQASK